MKELSLDYKAHLVSDPRAPIAFLVHGRAGTRDVMWTFRRAVPDGVSIIAPEAPIPDSAGGFSWWEVTGDITEPMIDRGAEALSSFIDESIEHFELTPRTIIALGFSQGAGALSVIFQRRPGLFTGVGLLAGFVIKDWQPPKMEPLRFPEIFIAHGTEDQVVPIDRARAGAEWLREKGAAVQFAEDEVGHKIGTNGMRALKEWMHRICEPSR